MNHTCKEDMTEYVGVTAGFNADTLPVYAKRSQRMVITARKQTLCPLCLLLVVSPSMCEYVEIFSSCQGR